MKPLILYTNPNSRGRIVRWMLEELGVPYDVQVMEYGSSIKSPDYLQINPMGKVPAIKHGEMVVTECAAICAYLADQFSDKGLAPAPGGAARGAYYRWLFFAAGPLEMAMSAKSCGWRIDDDNVQSIGCGYLDDVLNTLEQAIQQSPYLCGEQFTAADLYVGSHLGWGMMFKSIEERPVFKDYVQRLYSREAAIRANQLDDELQKQQAMA
ncbi:glutathione S-transferase family protein [Aliiglaciecola sp. CAU 1673]|uniref:glutathione S-transferase family protein n=1 Tax=Aliiglaciecola sp. CAU 1673 TaxID=3032595 RepID=UPI0023D988A4|nr:glutathione S-transferase family protein [Aliiglaciecola sp. CAU 1673]MDF2180129.1 glutathione S-transferase family protein [Aliiglaciecola sp. CAU 1673]